MKVIEQTNDYGCGVFSLHFLLGLYGIHTSVDKLERTMQTTSEDGTSHEGIKRGLSHHRQKYIEWENSNLTTLIDFLPAIVNYQWCDEDGCDGHYAVVLGNSHDYLIIYNPGTGEIEKLSKKEFEKNWYSNRYGKQWFIHLTEQHNADN